MQTTKRSKLNHIDLDSLKKSLESCGQRHLISHLSASNSYEKYFYELVGQITSMNIPNAVELFRAAQSHNHSVQDILPVHSISWNNLATESQLNTYDLGLDSIRSGFVAVIILSGGQGTRLGFNGPKGMYDIGLPSHKSIFQLHIEKIIKVKEISKATSIPVYIMTSELNDETIRNYFREHNFFGYSSNDIVFFQQGLQVSMSNDGLILLESETSLCLSPDGNGGMYPALAASGALDDMNRREIKHLHVYGIDNVLTKALDPAFLGLCIKNEVDVGNKVVWRASKNEKVGVTVQDKDGHMRVIEYSEIPTDLAEASIDGKLVFGAANICNHYLSLSFIQDQVLPNLSSTYHVAKKKIPHFDPFTRTMVTPTSANGMKLELFIFDVFPLARKWIVMEVDREDEFAPVKNEPGNPQDSPDTARRLISNQGKRWLLKAGVIIDEEDEKCESLCEVCPLISYDGEGLDHLAGSTLHIPIHLN